MQYHCPTTGCRRRQTASARASLPLSAAPEPQRYAAPWASVCEFKGPLVQAQAVWRQVARTKEFRS